MLISETKNKKVAEIICGPGFFFKDLLIFLTPNSVNVFSIHNYFLSFPRPTHTSTWWKDGQLAQDCPADYIFENWQMQVSD
jgi:hypothetical protein